MTERRGLGGGGYRVGGLAAIRGGLQCWWRLQGAVTALCSDCRVLSAASAGKEVGRLAALGLPGGKAAEGGVMKCERYAGGSPASGWWRVPTCQLSDFPTFRLVGKLGS